MEERSLFLLFYFYFFKVMNLVTHLGTLIFQVTTSSVRSVISMDLTPKISIFILDLILQISIQLHILIRPQSTSPSSDFSICLRYFPIPILSVSFTIYPNYNSNLALELVTTGSLLYPYFSLNTIRIY